VGSLLRVAAGSLMEVVDSQLDVAAVGAGSLCMGVAAGLAAMAEAATAESITGPLVPDFCRKKLDKVGEARGNGGI
jgi:hypothetical protein